MAVTEDFSPNLVQCMPLQHKFGSFPPFQRLVMVDRFAQISMIEK